MTQTLKMTQKAQRQIDAFYRSAYLQNISQPQAEQILTAHLQMVQSTPGLTTEMAISRANEALVRYKK